MRISDDKYQEFFNNSKFVNMFLLEKSWSSCSICGTPIKEVLEFYSPTKGIFRVGNQCIKYSGVKYANALRAIRRRIETQFKRPLKWEMIETWFLKHEKELRAIFVLRTKELNLSHDSYHSHLTKIRVAKSSLWNFQIWIKGTRD